jgi:hypothetical protein
VACQAIAGKPDGKTTHEFIALLLGQDAGGGDGEAAGISPHEGDLATFPAPQGQDPIDEQQVRRLGESLQGPQHGALGGGADTEPVDLRGTGLPD